MKRVFIALDVSNEARGAIGRHIGALRKTFPDVRASWVREQNLHITMKFFGEIDESGINGVLKIAEDTAANTDKFALRLSECGSFGRKVLFVGLADPNGELMQLNQQIETGAVAAGFATEKRRFNSHITIVRIRSERGAEKLIEAHNSSSIDPVEFTADGLVVYESTLSPGGSIYRALARFPFNER